MMPILIYCGIILNMKQTSLEEMKSYYGRVKKFNKRIFNSGVLDILKACVIHLIPSEVIEFAFKSKISKTGQFCAKEGINEFRPYVLKACFIYLIPSEVIEFPFKSKNSKAGQFCAKEGINKFRPYVLKAC